MERLKWYIPSTPLVLHTSTPPPHSVRAFVPWGSPPPFPCVLGRKHPALDPERGRLDHAAAVAPAAPRQAEACRRRTALAAGRPGALERRERLPDWRLALEQVERLADGGGLVQ